jgi:hypothetical protein
MAEQDTNKHETHEHHAAHEANKHHLEHKAHVHNAPVAKPSDNKTIIWILFVAALLIVAVVAYATGSHPSSNSTNQNQQTSPGVVSSNYGSQQTTVPPQSNMSPPTPVNISNVGYLLTPAEAASIIGAGGSVAFASTTPAQLDSPLFKNYSVTGEYEAQYNNNATNTQMKSSIVEIVYLSSKSPSIYKLVMNSSKATFNSTFFKTAYHATNSSYAINQTAGGMTYSFYGFAAPMPPANNSVTETVIVGFKNNSAVFVTLFRTNTTMISNATRVASIAAAHLN